jgi:DNA-binding transcriptional LysR family regulator
MTDDAEIDLNLMLALGALLEDRNLTRAGERIGMSQPAMSAALARLAIFEPPFGRVELVEAAYWHPSRSDDPAVRWLLKTLQEAARGLLSPRTKGHGLAGPGPERALVLGGEAGLNLRRSGNRR